MRLGSWWPCSASKHFGPWFPSATLCMAHGKRSQELEAKIYGGPIISPPQYKAFSSPPRFYLEQWFPTLGNPAVLGLQLPEAFTTSYTGQGFWELESENTWIAQSWEPLMRGMGDLMDTTTLSCLERQVSSFQWRKEHMQLSARVYAYVY